ncbi:MAG: hypothetical protein HYY55_03775 [Candidatus Niyogibacteria bacterium]|nr:MAG: hypothetical protein HYY55_03775 [Candidatus Niyogibacteria bacterium]
MAVFIWGRPRFTADVDIIIELRREDLGNLQNALRDLSKAGYVDKEMMKEAFARRGEFNFIDGDTGIKVDFWVAKGDDLAKQEFSRKIPKKIKNRMIYFISPEDLILRKLLWDKSMPSTKQLEDAESILKISGDKLDMKYLDEWARKTDVFETLQGLKR